MKNLAAELKKIRKEIKQSIEKEVNRRSAKIWKRQKKIMPWIGISYMLLIHPATLEPIKKKINQSDNPQETFKEEVYARASSIYDTATPNLKADSEEIALEQIKIYLRGAITKRRRLTGDELADILDDFKGDTLRKTYKKLRAKFPKITPERRRYRKTITIPLEQQGNHKGHKFIKIPLEDGEEARYINYVAWDLYWKMRYIYCVTCDEVIDMEYRKELSQTALYLSQIYQRRDDDEELVPSEEEHLLYDDPKNSDLIEPYDVTEKESLTHSEEKAIDDEAERIPINSLLREMEKCLIAKDVRIWQLHVEGRTNKYIGERVGMTGEGVRKRIPKIGERLRERLRMSPRLQRYMEWRKKVDRWFKWNFRYWK